MQEALMRSNEPVGLIENSVITTGVETAIQEGRDISLTPEANALMEDILDDPFAFNRGEVRYHDGPKLAWNLGVQVGKIEEVLISATHALAGANGESIFDGLSINLEGQKLAERMLAKNPELLSRVDPMQYRAFWRLCGVDIDDIENPAFADNLTKPDQIVTIISVLSGASFVRPSTIRKIAKYEQQWLAVEYDYLPNFTMTNIGDDAQVGIEQPDQEAEDFLILGSSVIYNSFLAKHDPDDDWSNRLRARVDEALPMMSGVEGAITAMVLSMFLRELGLHNQQIERFERKAAELLSEIDFDRLIPAELISLANTTLDFVEIVPTTEADRIINHAKAVVAEALQMYEIVEDPDIPSLDDSNDRQEEFTHQLMREVQQASDAKRNFKNLAIRLGLEQDPEQTSVEDMLIVLGNNPSDDLLKRLTKKINAEFDPSARTRLRARTNLSLSLGLNSLPEDHPYSRDAELLNPNGSVHYLAQFPAGQLFLGRKTGELVQNLEDLLGEKRQKLEEMENPAWSMAVSLDAVNNLIWFNPDFFTTLDGMKMLSQIRSLAMSAVRFTEDHLGTEPDSHGWMIRVVLSMIDFIDYAAERQIFVEKNPSPNDPIYETLLRQSYPQIFNKNREAMLAKARRSIN